ncbi:GDCCVxC domain-containing (seleno)protein [Spirosoma linguale]
MVLESTLVCPVCNHQQQETMPTNACQYFYEYSYCQSLLRPILGHCCVYCSYGSVQCPPVQQQKACCL